jgi:hypothetical protein
MKVKLLKILRKIGRNKIKIYSFTTINGTVTGMKIGYDEDEYRGLFSFGDTEAVVKEKACQIYLQTNIEAIRKKYVKYSKKFKTSHL